MDKFGHKWEQIESGSDLIRVNPMAKMLVNIIREESELDKRIIWKRCKFCGLLGWHGTNGMIIQIHSTDDKPFEEKTCGQVRMEKAIS
jgi:hypothetical protein